MTLWFVVLPLSGVKLIPRLPLPLSVLHAVHEHAVIDITVGPKVKSVLILGLIVDKPTHVDISCRVLQAVAVLAVVLEVALVKA